MNTPRGRSGPTTRRTTAVIPGRSITAAAHRAYPTVREPANNDTGAPTPPSELDDDLGNPSDVTPDRIRVDEDAVDVVGSDTGDGDSTGSPVSLSEGDDDEDKDKDDKKETSHVKYAEGDGDKDKEDADKKDD